MDDRYQNIHQFDEVNEHTGNLLQEGVCINKKKVFSDYFDNNNDDDREIEMNLNEDVCVHVIEEMYENIDN